MNDNNELIKLVHPKRLGRPTRLAPISCRDKGASIVASACCPVADGQIPRIVMLFVDSKFRVYDADTLVENINMSASEEYATAICACGTDTFVAGKSDGSLMLLHMLEFYTLSIFKAHDEAVVYVDYRNGHVVSVGRDLVLKVSRLIDGELLPVLSEAKLVDMPITAKLFSINGVLRVLVAYRGSSRLEVYETESLGFVESLDLQWHTDTLLGHGLVDLVLDETRTKFAAAFDNKWSVHILTGFLSDFTSTQECVVSSSEGIYSKPKVSWSSTGSDIWVIDDNGAISKVRLPDGRVFTEVVDHIGAVANLQVCCIDGDEAIITGGVNGIFTLWR